MGFYIRKSFKAGPIRFNLSKSGIGVSAGVRGARIGTGPRGDYISGGTSGLYFRESLDGKRKRTSSRGTAASAFTFDVAGDEFVDTGATFPTPVRPSALQIVDIPSIPRPKNTQPFFWAGGGFLLFAIFGLPELSPVTLTFFILALVSVGVGVSKWRDNLRLKRAGSSSEALFEKLLQEYKADKLPVLDEIPEEIIRGPGAVHKAFSFRAGRLFVVSYLINRMDESSLREHLERLELTEDEAASLKRQVFADLFNKCIEDLVLDKEEEWQLKSMAEKLHIPAGEIKAEMEAIKYLSSIRAQAEAPLETIDPGIALPKNERCYFRSPVRLLKEKILKSRTVAGTKVKTRGHEVECEGTVYLTNKRILLVAEGTKSYPIAKILDCTLNLESNILEVTVDGRKTPVLLTMPAIAPFAAKLEKIQQLA